ncbi:MAG: hypothetical protein DMF97_14470 [Acidobacteria bacterium]|nr:MAG: hypothetical protein DMF97_14470 [Acidobacteriota bacterium]
MSNDRNPSPAGIGSMAIGLGRAATIVVADDEWMFMACLRQLLTAPPPTIKDVYGIDVGAGFTVVGEAGSGEDTVSIVEATKPDLPILDLEMPRMWGLDVMRALQDVPWNLRTIVLAGNVGKSELFKVRWSSSVSAVLSSKMRRPRSCSSRFWPRWSGGAGSTGDSWKI